MRVSHFQKLNLMEYQNINTRNCNINILFSPKFLTSKSSPTVPYMMVYVPTLKDAGFKINM